MKSIEEISKGLKWFIVIHMIVCFMFGIFFFFAIEAYTVLFSWPFLDPIVGRYVGAFFIGLGLTDIFVYRETEWNRIEYYIISLILAFIFECIALTWGIFLSNTWAVYLNLFISAAFLIGFVYFYMKQRK